MSCPAVRIAALALLIGLALPGTAQAQNPAVYRVELILVEQDAQQFDRRPAATPLDFTSTPDPLQTRQLAAEVERLLPLVRDTLEPLSGDPPANTAEIHSEGSSTRTTVERWLENEVETIRPAPDLWTAPPGPSAEMQRAWQRLSNSADFRPLSWTGWFQTAPRGRAGRSQRVHDGRVIDRSRSLSVPRPLMHPDLSFVPELQRPGVPRMLSSLFGLQATTEARYRLDGEASLRQRQFLHLSLNLVWQEPNPLADPNLPTPDDATASMRPIAEKPGSAIAFGDEDVILPWLQHRLRDARVIRPDRFEYFDAGRFGVLARVTRFRQEVREPEPVETTVPSPGAAAPARDVPSGS